MVDSETLNMHEPCTVNCCVEVLAFNGGRGGGFEGELRLGSLVGFGS